MKAKQDAKPPKRPAMRRGDALAREVEQILKPILGPAREKAELLVEHLATQQGRRFDFDPKGLGDAIRRLRATLTDDEIRAGARGLVASLAKLYGDRETVA